MEIFYFNYSCYETPLQLISGYRTLKSKLHFNYDVLFLQSQIAICRLLFYPKNNN